MWTGLILGIITFIGFVETLHRAPRPVKWFVRKFPFLTDLVVSAGSYLLLGSMTNSLAGAIGSGLAGILFGGYLWYQGNKEVWKRQLTQPPPSPHSLPSQSNQTTPSPTS